MNLKTKLDIPIPFLIQQNTDFSFIDSIGWSIMHYAVIDNNIKKINEMIFSEIDFNIKASTNEVPVKYLLSKGKEYQDIYKGIDTIQIPYCENGYTPLHLSVFLYSLYKDRTHPDYDMWNKEQERIFLRLIYNDNNSIFWKDNQNLTVTDYCILSFNLDYLKEIKKIDRELNSLSGVSLKTAIKIFQNELSSINTQMGQDLDFMKEMKEFFSKKEQAQILEDFLPKKENEKQEIVKI